MKKIKVFIFIDSFRIGGMHRQMLFLSKYLNKNIFDPIVCTSGPLGNLRLEFEKTGCRLIDLKWKKTFDIMPVVRLVKVLKAECPDIVFITEPQNFVYYRLARIFWRRKVRNIGSFRALTFWKGHLSLFYKDLDNFLCRWFYLASDHIVVNSFHMKEHYNKLVKPKPSNPFMVIRNGNDFKFNISKTEQEIRLELGLDKDEIFVLMVARLDPWKDFDTIIDAFIQSKKVAPAIKLYLIGGGILEAELKSKINNREADKYIQVVGEKVDIQNYIKYCDISVLSSYGEGFSNSILESMALGKPVIATDIGGNPEIIGTDGKAGIIIAPQSPREFSKAIVELAMDVKIRKNIGKAAIKRIKDLCDLNKFIMSYEELFIRITKD